MFFSRECKVHIGVVQFPPFANEESKSAYMDFLASLDLINQHGDFIGTFNGKVPKQALNDLLISEEDVARFSNKVNNGKSFKRLARWERQARPLRPAYLIKLVSLRPLTTHA